MVLGVAGVDGDENPTPLSLVFPQSCFNQISERFVPAIKWPRLENGTASSYFTRDDVRVKFNSIIIIVIAPDGLTIYGRFVAYCFYLCLIGVCVCVCLY